MRLALAFASLALLAILAPTASAAQELPAAELPVGVRVYQDTQLPGEDGCYDCLGATVVVGTGFTGCCDLPWFAVGAAFLTGDADGDTDVRVFACYTAFVGICFVDQTVTIPVG